jgi:hypothetical protein
VLLLRRGFLLAKGMRFTPTYSDCTGDICRDLRWTANMLKKAWAWWTQKSKRDLLLEAVADARLFEEWEAAAYALDETLDYDMW